MSNRRPGATGRYPRGKLNREDEGELNVAIAADRRHGVVQIDFGKEVAWLALPKEQALAWAKMIREEAMELT